MNCQELFDSSSTTSRMKPKEINNFLSEEDEEEFNYLLRIISKLPIISKKQRIIRKLSQKKMAELIGINRWLISQLENGNNVNFKTIYKTDRKTH